MARVGGARSGAGRPKGSVSKRSVDVAAKAMADGITPIEFMLSIMRDESADQKRREWAAEKVAPYVHPRPTPIDQPVALDLPDTATLTGVDDAQAEIIRKVSKGEITPTQGQNISALVEARRRSIESGELLRRIEALEEAKS